MISIHSVDRLFKRYPSVAGLIYLALLVVCGLATVFALSDLVDLYLARNASLDVISRFDARNHSVPGAPGASTDAWPPGSPFLEGKTATIANATLLQRITNTITRAGGMVISSEVQRQGGKSKDGYVTAMATFDLEQTALQTVLYEIEAGMPFLFIDQLAVQVPTPPAQGSRMHIVLAVSGQWRGEE